MIQGIFDSCRKLPDFGRSMVIFMMKKLISTGLCLLVCAGILAGCGTELESDTSVVYVDKKGGVIFIDVEELDSSYYDETELRASIEDVVAEYTQEYGEGTVKVADITVEGETAKLTLKYKTAEDFSRLNRVEMYQGKVVKALADGYDFNVDFARVKDGAVLEAVSKEEVLAEDDLKVVMIKANMDVRIEGEIRYVSCENVQLTGKDSISIRSGYQIETGAGAGVTPSSEQVEQGTEQADSTETIKGTITVEDSNGEASPLLNADVYTYIIYK